MSSGLYKFNSFYPVQKETFEKRIIDTNEIAAKRLETLAEIMKASAEKGGGQGFVQGLDAKEVATLLEDETETGSNVIKANDPNAASEIVEQAREEATEILKNAREQADIIVKEAVEQAENSKKNVLEEARMLGYREGINRANKEIDQLKAEMAETERRLQEEHDVQMESMEADLVETITGVYEHIFNDNISAE